MKNTARSKRTKQGRAGLPALLSLCPAVMLLSFCIGMALLMSGCGSAGPKQGESDAAASAALDAYPEIDISDYAGLADTKNFATYKDLTVKDIVALQDAKATFAFIATFADCPWCNAVNACVNQAAYEEGIPLGVLDTRKNPAWNNNLEIDDYDLFAERFGAYLEEDVDGKPHLYVPHIFYIREGEVVYEHQGALAEMGDDPETEITPEMEDKLTNIFRHGFMEMR